MFEKPILIYSDYCQHCQKFIASITEIDSLFEKFIRLNIDVDPVTRKRPQVFYELQQKLEVKITEVPTIIVGNGNYVLSGLDAFKWLDFVQQQQHAQPQQTSQQTSQPQPPTGVHEFNPNEMLGFSSGYSPLIGEAGAGEHSFKFINKHDEPIPTPQESGGFSQDDYKRKMAERDQLNVPPNPMRPTSAQNLQAPLPPRPHMSTQPQKSKEKEMDDRFQQLLAEREASVPIKDRRPVL